MQGLSLVFVNISFSGAVSQSGERKSLVELHFQVIEYIYNLQDKNNITSIFLQNRRETTSKMLRNSHTLCHTLLVRGILLTYLIIYLFVYFSILFKGKSFIFFFCKTRKNKKLVFTLVKSENCTFASFVWHFLILNYFFPAETGREVQSEPQRAHSLRVPRPGGVGVQLAPARARDHAPLQTPAADLLALVTHQGDERQALLLILSLPRYPSSLLVPRLNALRYRSAVGRLRQLITTNNKLLPSETWDQPKGLRFLKRSFVVWLLLSSSSSLHGLLSERVQPSANQSFF